MALRTCRECQKPVGHGSDACPHCGATSPWLRENPRRGNDALWVMGTLIIGMTLLVFLSGCFHTMVSTGARPSPGVLKKSWATGWFWGLIGPDVVNASAACRNGVALVETERSFGNQVASFFTLGIYAPMSITVTCAAAPKPVP